MKIAIVSFVVAMFIAVSCDNASDVVDTPIKEPIDTIDTPTIEPYSILTPKNGDVVYLGDTLKIAIAATVTGKQAGLKLVWKDGLYPKTIMPINISGDTFDPNTTPLIEYKIPNFFIDRRFDRSKNAFVIDTLIPVDDKCYVLMFDYNDEEQATLTQSKGYFKIKKRD